MLKNLLYLSLFCFGLLACGRAAPPANIDNKTKNQPIILDKLL